MKKKTNTNARLILAALAACALLLCCREDWDQAAEEKGEKVDDFGISVQIPFTEEDTALRSLGETEENAIQTFDVLSFRVGDDGKDYFDYYAEGRAAAGNTAGAKVQDFRFAAWIRSYRQRFVVVTNARNKLQELLHASECKGLEKNSMLSSLEVSLSADKKWNAISASNYKAFPMWGESAPAVITFGSQSAGSVSLLRMIAKVDVQLEPTVTNFKLKSVRVYNVYTKGRIVPTARDLVTVPTGSYPDKGPIVYSDFGTPGVPDVAIRNSIYLLESPATQEHLKATCLVIGGLYENDVQQTYYRVDFKGSDGVTNEDILRNYKYTINITQVLDRGHADEEEAFESKAENMQTEVEIWSGSNLAVSFNGQYFLYVNKNLFDFTREACTTAQNHNILIVNTNYKTATAQGWRISNMTDESGRMPGWLTVTAPNGTTNIGAYSTTEEEDTLILTYTENTTGRPRYANLVFAAGRLRYTVNVIQEIREGVSITFYDGAGVVLPGANVLVPSGPVIDTLKFYYPSVTQINQEAKPFTVTWAPKEADVRVFETHKYVTPIFGITCFLDFNTNPSRLRVITSHTGISVYHIGLEFKHTSDDRTGMYYAQSAIGFYVSNGVEDMEKVIVFVCYPPTN
ncbi:MAG: hypothetical protein LBH19_06665 [Dysgonamonadaceae bacterium]|jgi:hypothetical protein|nr:hypothetical protein [Dysgonamonadaceae bacterium]